MAAKLQFDKGQTDAARASLAWVADNAGEDEYCAPSPGCAWPACWLEAKQYDEALKQLDAAKAAGFEALVADRRGDVLRPQGQQGRGQGGLPGGLEGAWTRSSTTAALSMPS